MKIFNIRNRILLAALLPSILLAVMLATLFLRDRLNVLNEAYQQKAKAMTRQLAVGSEFGLFSGNRAALQTLIDRVAKEDDVRSITVFDGSGAMVAQTGSPIAGFVPTNVEEVEPRIEMQGNLMVVRFAIIGADLPLDDLLWHSTPGNGKSLGHLMMELSTERIAAQSRRLQQTWVLFTLAVLAFGVLLSVILSKDLVRRIVQVADVVASIGRGDLSARVVTDPEGPLWELEDGVNGMARRIEAGRDDLEQRVVDATSSLRQHQDHLEELVRQRTEQVVAMSIELTKTEERERRALAQDLHDGLGQLLAVAKLRLSVIDVSPEALAGIKPELEFIDRLIGEANQSVRSLSLQLGPSLPETMNLASALSWMVDSVQSTFDLQVNLNAVEFPEFLDPAILLTLVRVTRELLVNVARHSTENVADLTTMFSGDRLIVSVSDSGIGFDPGQAPRPSGRGGFGLLSVRERIAYLGGEFNLDSSPGNGTVAIVSFPLRRIRGEAGTAA